MLQVLAAIGACASYADLAQATGLPLRTLMNTVGHLRRCGYVERVNPDEPGNEVALFRRTDAGDRKLEAVAPDPANAAREVSLAHFDSLTTVQRAIRTQPPLATVWRA